MTKTKNLQLQEDGWEGAAFKEREVRPWLASSSGGCRTNPRVGLGFSSPALDDGAPWLGHPDKVFFSYRREKQGSSGRATGETQATSVASRVSWPPAHPRVDLGLGGKVRATDAGEKERERLGIAGVVGGGGGGVGWEGDEG